MSFKIDQFNERTQRQIRASLQAENTGKIAKLESNIGNEPLATKEVQRSTSTRFRVCVRTRRKRLLDEDNICEKFAIDALRYCGAIPDDNPERTRIEVTQTKCGKGESEEILIEVFELC